MLQLTRCPKCKHKVSNDAKTCYACGARLTPRVIHSSNVYLLIAFIGVLVAAAFSTKVAEYTMPRNVLMGTLVACASDVVPDMFAGSVAALDAVDLAGPCHPNWFKAIRFGMPSVDAEIFVEAHCSIP